MVIHGLQLFILSHSAKFSLSGEIQLLNELFKFKIAIKIRFNVHFIPRNLSKSYTEEALCVESVLAVYKEHIPFALACNFRKLENIGRCYKFYFVKIFTVANHIITSDL